MPNQRMIDEGLCECHDGYECDYCFNADRDIGLEDHLRFLPLVEGIIQELEAEGVAPLPETEDEVEEDDLSVEPPPVQDHPVENPPFVDLSQEEEIEAPRLKRPRKLPLQEVPGNYVTDLTGDHATRFFQPSEEVERVRSSSGAIEACESKNDEDEKEESKDEEEETKESK